MKRECILTFLWTWVISFTLALGIAGCLATAFEFAIPFRLWAVMALGCAAAAVLCGFRFGFLTGFGVLIAGTAFLWHRGTLSGQLSALVQKITKCYH